MKPRFQDLFAIDPRSLAIFRMAMALLILADLAVRFSDLNAMYTDDGMFSRAEICRRATTIWNWSFHFASGQAGFQTFLFALAAVLAGALLIGYETRLATIGSWLMLLSIQHRVPTVQSGAETLHRALLFWAMFLPLGQVWSLDARRKVPGQPPDFRPILSIASAALLLQMALMYLFSAVYKSNAEWFSGTVILGSLTHDFFASPASVYFLKLPALLVLLTWGTLLLEWLGPLLLFSPKGAVRIAVIAALALMHIGIGAALEIGTFSYVSMLGLLVFLPRSFWESRLFASWRQESTASATGSKPAPRSRRYLAAQAACGLLFLYVLAVNLNSFPSHPLGRNGPELWKPLTRGLGLSQSWGMFEATPSRSGWYVARAKLRNGSEVDLLRGGAPVDWQKPPFPARLYPNHYWQKLFREMAYDDEQGFQLFRKPVAEFLCRDWNIRHPSEQKVVDFEFVYCMQDQPGSRILPPRYLHEQLVHLDFASP